MITGSTKLSAKELNAIFFYSNVYFLNKHTEPLLLTKVFSSSKFHGIIFHWHIAFRQLTKIQLQHIDEYDLDSITLERPDLVSAKCSISTTTIFRGYKNGILAWNRLTWIGIYQFSCFSIQILLAFNFC